MKKTLRDIALAKQALDLTERYLGTGISAVGGGSDGPILLMVDGLTFRQAEELARLIAKHLDRVPIEEPG